MSQASTASSVEAWALRVPSSPSLPRETTKRKRKAKSDTRSFSVIETCSQLATMLTCLLLLHHPELLTEQQTLHSDILVFGSARTDVFPLPQLFWPACFHLLPFTSQGRSFVVTSDFKVGRSSSAFDPLKPEIIARKIYLLKTVFIEPGH